MHFSGIGTKRHTKVSKAVKSGGNKMDKYEELILEIIEFQNTDILTGSDTDTDDQDID